MKERGRERVEKKWSREEEKVKGEEVETYEKAEEGYKG